VTVASQSDVCVFDVFPYASRFVNSENFSLKNNAEKWRVFRIQFATALYEDRCTQNLASICPSLAALDFSDFEDLSWVPYGVDFSIRTSNGFRRYVLKNQIDSWQSLLVQPLSAFFQTDAVGKKSAIEYLEAVFELAVKHPDRNSSKAVLLPTQVNDPLSIARKSAVQRIREYVQWVQVVEPNSNVRSLINRLYEKDVPEDCIQDIEVLLNTPLLELEEPFDITGLLSDFVDSLEDVQRYVLNARLRLIKSETKTLQEVGEEVGVTRERIRQVEAKAISKVMNFLDSNQGKPIKWQVDHTLKLLGNAFPIEVGAEFLGRFTDQIAISDALIRMLLCDYSGYETLDGWLVRGDASSFIQSASDKANSFGVFDRPLDEYCNELGVASVYFEKFLSEVLSAQRVMGSWVLPRRSVGDWAELVLRLRGEPMSPEEVNDSIPVSRSLQSLINSLGEMESVLRTDRRMFALREWGLEEYSGISEEIAERIDRNGGSVRVDDVIEELTEQFSVSASSVKSYVTTSRFVVSDGWVRLRRSDERHVVHASITEARGYFFLDPKLVFLCNVDKDLLRGSGRALNTAVVNVAKLQPGSNITLTSQFGPVALTWNRNSTQPAIGSLKAVAEALHAREGDRLRVEIDVWSSQIDLALVNESAICSGPSTDSVYELTGVQASTVVECSRDLASALGCKPNEVRGALRERGDIEVLEAMPTDDMSIGLEQAALELSSILMDDF